jgi:two-component system, NtrC family, response regulator AtoC
MPITVPKKIRPPATKPTNTGAAGGQRANGATGNGPTGNGPGFSGRSIDFPRMLDDLPMGILVMDAQRRVQFCNRALATLIGVTTQGVRGLSCYNVLRSRACLLDCPAVAANPASAAVCCETDLINRDRKRIPVRITSAPIFDLRRRRVGFLETVEDLRPLKELSQKACSAYGFANIVGQSAQMEKLFRMVPVIAQSDSSVLITGETGTGKDMLADALHQESERAKGSFIKVNCGALPETLLESELFGHTKGAFTGAVENKQGRFHLAHNGTLYLTEIGDLPLPLQVKLLTFLDDKIVYPLGGTKGFAANVRIIAATHRNLEQMVRDGLFRQDLFFRLNVLRLHIPALREREGDIRLLLDYFLKSFTLKMNRSITGYTRDAMQVLLSYSYPGNVRELRNIVEYAVNVGHGARIDIDDLPAYLTEYQHFLTPENGSVPAPVEREGPEVALTDGTWPMAEKQIIMDALIKAKGNRSQASALLGWARSTLWRKMKHYGLVDE